MGIGYQEMGALGIIDKGAPRSLDSNKPQSGVLMGAQDVFSVAISHASLQWLLILLPVTDKPLISHSTMRKTFLALSYWQKSS